jgi:hypothetical protein
MMTLGFACPGCKRAAVAAGPSSSPIEVAPSHIEGHVPPAAEFSELLHSDLATYLAKTYGAPRTIQVMLLREGPTQSGVSLPKYYVWVRFQRPDATFIEGAARVAAVDKTHFEVTDFLTAEQVVNAPTILSTVFPEPLREEILRRAKTAFVP